MVKSFVKPTQKTFLDKKVTEIKLSKEEVSDNKEEEVSDNKGETELVEKSTLKTTDDKYFNLIPKKVFWIGSGVLVLVIGSFIAYKFIKK